MSKIITMEDGLKEMKQAFPEDAAVLNDRPSLGTVYTGCRKMIHFCLISYAQGYYYVKELITGRSYKAKTVYYTDMKIGVQFENFTAIECENHQLAVKIN